MNKSFYLKNKIQAESVTVEAWLLSMSENKYNSRCVWTVMSYSGWAFSGLVTVAGRGVGGKKAPLPKICHRYPTMMKIGTVIPYLKNIQNIYESRDTTLDFCWYQYFFHWKSASFVISRNTDIYCIFRVLKCFFNKPDYNFDDISKNG